MKLFVSEEQGQENGTYNTITHTIDIHKRGDRLILVTDSDNLKVYRDDIYQKWKLSSYAIFSLFFLQLITHFYLSYHNLIDCETKINRLYQIHIRMEKNSKEITYICASYLMHIFLMVGYFFLVFLTLI
jgi:hypothetical protein